ncbi:MFS transporter [Rhodococcus rhodnii]|uniref:Major facilitator superfamily multidrug n=2 Tax=Rhodococcus rhodnii TaxID=38312 RepID=R7WRB7_9NOCA|nr:MFS transporter [Rhodococcus rhodnii]EOM77863.1 major facilitator superfamily multidrug [Rhodococcus rhodnii LMG 5362]TXG88963.1 MFS transporter [Rhodococcus rhodnii]
MAVRGGRPKSLSAAGIGGAPGGLWTIIGYLAGVEIVSGILQAYYTPLFPQIADHLAILEGDVNWFEAAQLALSALVVPLLSRLGDLWGHRNVLLVSTAIVAAGSWILVLAPGFTVFLIGWSLQAAYAVWLPIEIALIHRRATGPQQAILTRRAAAYLVAALEIGCLVGALAAGALSGVLGVPALMAVPALAVTGCFVVVLLGVRDAPVPSGGRFDLRGLGVFALAIGLVMTGLVTVRVLGPSSPLPWLVLVLGVAAFAGFVPLQLRTTDPLVDVRLLGRPGQWPVQLAAFLFGMSVLGAQIPLSTFAQADPDRVGYGLGVGPGAVSLLVGLYVLCMAAGALLMPFVATRVGQRGAITVGLLVVAAGYGSLIPLNAFFVAVMLGVAVAGLGSGALVAALPASAASAAPPERTAFATGATNTTKTIGGALASAMFALALTSTGSADPAATGGATLGGYLVVWAICAGSAAIAAAVVAFAPREPASAEPLQ